jgi:tellurite methyltransferase
MDQNQKTAKQYDERYGPESLYWGSGPSAACFEILKRMPPGRSIKVLDIGCGEGRNALFLARNGYDVSAFDISDEGVEKTARLAERLGVSINVFQANVVEFRLSEEYDILFSTAVFQCIPEHLRPEIFENYKSFTRPGGLNVFSVFVQKPFIAPAPDADANSSLWRSGELFSQYHDWRIEWCTEEVFDCMSSGVPHQHAVNRIIAKREAEALS